MDSPRPKITTLFLDSDSEDGEDEHILSRFCRGQRYGARPVSSSGYLVSPSSGSWNPSLTDYVLDDVEAFEDEFGVSVGVELIAKLNEVIEENAKSVVHSVEVASARLTQLETRACRIEGSMDDLKISVEYYNGKTNRKLKQLENVLGEVQTGVKYLKDKQEIAETNLRLANLQLAQSRTELENQKANIHTVSSQPTPSYYMHHQSERQIPASSAVSRANPLLANMFPTLKNQCYFPPVSAGVTHPQLHWPSSHQQVESHSYTAALSYHPSIQQSQQPVGLSGRAPLAQPFSYLESDRSSNMSSKDFPCGNSSLSEFPYLIGQNFYDGSASCYESSQMQSS